MVSDRDTENGHFIAGRARQIWLREMTQDPVGNRAEEHLSSELLIKTWVLVERRGNIASQLAHVQTPSDSLSPLPLIPFRELEFGEAIGQQAQQSPQSEFPWWGREFVAAKNSGAWTQQMLSLQFLLQDFLGY